MNTDKMQWSGVNSANYTKVSPNHILSNVLPYITDKHQGQVVPYASVIDALAASLNTVIRKTEDPDENITRTKPFPLRDYRTVCMDGVQYHIAIDVLAVPDDKVYRYYVDVRVTNVKESTAVLRLI